MLRAILIDDEVDSTRVLGRLLERYCADVEVVATCNDGEDAVDLIGRLRPDLVFMDIEMPRFNGFQVLEALDDVSFMLIFTTAYSQYALRAFKYSALDYLMKPIAPDELMATVARAKQRSRVDAQQIEILRTEMTAASVPTKKFSGKIAVPNMHGFMFVDLAEIAAIESDGNYAYLHMLNGQKHFISRSIGDMEEMMPADIFFRIHRQFLVNLTFINEYIRTDSGILVLHNGQRIPVSRNRREEFILLFEKM